MDVNENEPLHDKNQQFKLSPAKTDQPGAFAESDPSLLRLYEES